MNTEVKTTDKGTKSIKMGESSVAGDWINRIMDSHARVVTQEAVEAVAAVPGKEAVKDKDGNVIEEAVEAVAAVRGRAEKTALDDDKINALASENHLALKDEYPNIGMKRMALSNKMRAAAKRRGGLMLPEGEEGAFVWVEAPEDFEVNEKLTENADGSRIATKPAAVAEETGAAEAAEAA